jgi:hypothetical protein
MRRLASLTNIKLNSQALLSCQRAAVINVVLRPTTPRRHFSNNVSVLQEESFNNNNTSTLTQHVGREEAELTPFWKISSKAFDEKQANVLSEPLASTDIEIKPDGIIYLPEIRYRRILNRAFGPGGWGLMPRGNYVIEKGFICQQFALFCNGQFVSQAWGEQSYDEEGKSPINRSLATALEGAKSNALMRCCKDLGIASELWDPQFILQWKAENALEVWGTHTKTGAKKKLYRRKDRPAFEYPYSEETGKSSGNSSSYKSQPATTSSPVADIDHTVDTFEAPNEEADVNMFDTFDMDQVPTTKEKKSKKSAPAPSSDEFNWEDLIKFGKYKGKKWTEAMPDPGFKSYLEWMLKEGKASAQVKAAHAMISQQ